jgi:hypothetical protein
VHPGNLSCQHKQTKDIDAENNLFGHNKASRQTAPGICLPTHPELVTIDAELYRVSKERMDDLIVWGA